MLINDTLHTTSPLRQRIRDYYRISESVAVDQILPIAEAVHGNAHERWCFKFAESKKGTVVLTHY